MDYIDTAIDRIHYLMERVEELYTLGMEVEAALLFDQAYEISQSIKEPARTPAIAG
jgi:hypothetical protein